MKLAINPNVICALGCCKVGLEGYSVGFPHPKKLDPDALLAHSYANNGPPVQF